MALTVKERLICDENDIAHTTAYYRIKRGWDRQIAITKPVSKPWTVIARENGINPKTYENRVYGCGWEKEEAATTPVDTRFRSKKRRGTIEL